MAGRKSGAVKAIARHQHQAADAGGRRGAAGLGDAGDRQRRRFGLVRALLQNLDRRHVRVEQIERRKVARQQRRVGEAGEAILGRGARHGHRALGERIEAVALDVVGGYDRLLLADQDAQADVVALGALGFLDGAVAHLDREGDAAHRDGVGCVGARALRGGDQAFGEIGEGGLIKE